MQGNNNQLFLACLVLGSAFIFWSVSAGLSDFLAEQPSREVHEKHATRGNVKKIPPQDINHSSLAQKESRKLVESEIKRLRDEWKKNEASPEARMKLAQALFEFGVSLSKGDYLKEAVGHFHEILEEEPENVDALFGMASLSLHVGVADRASVYYKKLLDLRPDDLATRANYALALSRAGKSKEGFGEIQSALLQDPKNPLSLVTQGLIQIDMGNVDLAKESFQTALQYEENPFITKRIQELLTQTSLGSAQTITSTQNNPTPKEYIITQVEIHPILSGKFNSVTIEEGEQKASIALNNFPVEQMPEFAKVKLVTRLQEWQKATQLSEIIVIDSLSQKVLLSSKNSN